MIEALDRLREQGVALDYLRIRGFPFGADVREFLARHERHIVIEQNRDGQLRSLLILDTGIAPDRLLSLLDYGGIPLGTNRVMRGIQALLAGAPVPA